MLDAVLDVVTALPLCGLELCSLCVEMTQLVLYGDMLAGQHMQLPVINTNLDICFAERFLQGIAGLLLRVQPQLNGVDLGFEGGELFRGLICRLS